MKLAQDPGQKTRHIGMLEISGVHQLVATEIRAERLAESGVSCKQSQSQRVSDRAKRANGRLGRERTAYILLYVKQWPYDPPS